MKHSRQLLLALSFFFIYTLRESLSPLSASITPFLVPQSPPAYSPTSPICTCLFCTHVSPILTCLSIPIPRSTSVSTLYVERPSHVLCACNISSRPGHSDAAVSSMSIRWVFHRPASRSIVCCCGHTGCGSGRSSHQQRYVTGVHNSPLRLRYYVIVACACVSFPYLLLPHFRPPLFPLHLISLSHYSLSISSPSPPPFPYRPQPSQTPPRWGMACLWFMYMILHFLIYKEPPALATTRKGDAEVGGETVETESPPLSSLNWLGIATVAMAYTVMPFSYAVFEPALIVMCKVRRLSIGTRDERLSCILLFVFLPISTSNDRCIRYDFSKNE